MIDTVVFDFDGTLADTNQMIINSFRHIYGMFLNKECSEDYIMSTFGEPLNLTLTRDFGQFDFDEVINAYRDYQRTKFNDEVTLYETVEETLEYLKNKDIKLGVATSRFKNSTMKALERFNIAKYFDSVVSADDVTKHKPDKEPLIKVITELKSTSNRTLYVGDSKFDIECALNAAATPVLVGWQSNSRELADKYNIEHVLEKMWDLTGMIK
ncbi:MAG: HAD-IA family hydrolase [Sedimentibacter sp.]|uniref:HAD family hydrolase n=1 Tax=Sedimentibacter sp. TaxID=1960295 RepID=UPI003158FCA2